jgi:hypothetical protein
MKSKKISEKKSYIMGVCETLYTVSQSVRLRSYFKAKIL